MKVVAINGSPHKEGNTFHALNMVGTELIAAGIEFEIIHIGHKEIHGCMACNNCSKNRDEKCSIKKDDLNDWIQKLKNADGILIGSPVYYAGIPGTMKCFLDRVFYVAGSNGNLFRHKVGAAVDSLNHYLLYSEMILATSSYWNVIHGTSPGEVENDEEGVQIMHTLGKNMAWLLKMKDATSTTIEEPKKDRKVMTNFIR